MGKIDRLKPKGGKRILAPEPPQSTDHDPPAFCLQHLATAGFNACTKDERLALINKMKLLSQMTWVQIKSQPKHGTGSEPIPQKSIDKPIPSHITSDVQFLALRFDGKKAMVGYRIGRVFHIVWLDRDFSVYKH